MEWHAHRDWAGWSFGWYPTKADPRCLTLQHIGGYCFNLDVSIGDRHDWRLALVYRRNSLEEANRRAMGRGPEPRFSLTNYAHAS